MKQYITISTYMYMQIKNAKEATKKQVSKQTRTIK